MLPSLLSRGKSSLRTISGTVPVSHMAGRPHVCSTVGLQRALKKVPPLGIHTLLDFYHPSTRHKTSDDKNSPHNVSISSLPARRFCAVEYQYHTLTGKFQTASLKDAGLVAVSC